MFKPFVSSKQILALMLALALALLSLTGCSDAEIKAKRATKAASQTTPAPSPQEADAPRQTSPDLSQSIAATSAALEQSISATSTAVMEDIQAQTTSQAAPIWTPIPTDTPVVLADAGQWYAIDATAHSDNDVLDVLTLHLLRAQRTDEGLLLRIAFEYEGDSEMSILGGVSRRDIRLTDASGNGYDLLDGDQAVISFNPDGYSFLPGGGVAGNLIFPLPAGKQPYTLHFPTFDPVEFRLKKKMKPPLTALRPGHYDVGQTLRSNSETMQPIALRVDSVDVGEKDVTFHVAFVNTGRRGYDVSGPDGMHDAWLIDTERNQYVPVRVSDNLTNSIAPPDGWQPGQAHEGTITFPVPTAPGGLHFTFRYYPAITLAFDKKGLTEAQVTSRTGGPPPATATPRPDQLAYQAISQMLAQQARAILDGDEDAYLAPFAPDLREAQRAIFRRMQDVPFDSYALELSPNEDLDDADAGVVSDVSVWGRYTLAGIPEDNDFRYTADYDFMQQGGSWRITAIANDDFTPFWFLGDVALDHSSHFIIFTRPDTTARTSTLAKELEAAYDDLKGKGLPLEPMNVAFFTGPDEDLFELTGRSGTRVLGLALAQYSFEESRVHVNSRAFFINGKAFAEHADELAAGERASTITHEMVHLALSRDSRPFIPPWLSEGLAVYYAQQASPEQLKTLVSEGRLNELSLTDLTAANSLGEHDIFGQTVGYEYLYSGAVITYLMQNFGEDQVMAFYRAYSQVPDAELAEKFSGMFASLLADAHMSQMAQEKTPGFVQQSFGLSLEELDAAVKAWLATL